MKKEVVEAATSKDRKHLNNDIDGTIDKGCASAAKIPVIKCLPRDDCSGGLMFWCPFCKEWHYHGKDDGHRIAHCTGYDSPFDQTGYELRMMSKKELRNIRKAIDDYLGERRSCQNAIF